MAKRQFKGTKAPRLFFDRRVRPTGNTRSVSLGKLIPEGWYFIRIRLIDRDENSVTVKFEKLLELPNNACDKKDSEASQQNT